MPELCNVGNDVIHTQSMKSRRFLQKGRAAAPGMMPPEPPLHSCTLWGIRYATLRYSHFRKLLLSSANIADQQLRGTLADVLSLLGCNLAEQRVQLLQCDLFMPSLLRRSRSVCFC